MRVRLYEGATLVGSYFGTAAPTTTLDEGCCSANIDIPAAMVRSGIAMLADVDPDNSLLETNEQDNAFPASGVAKAFAVNTVPSFHIRLVPVQFAKSGRTGAISSTIMSMATSLWPLGQVTAERRAAFSTDLPDLVSDDANGSWSELLRQIEQLRRLENSNAYYYGVVNTGYNSGVAGLGYIEGKSSIGWDAGNGSDGETLAHELGHNFSRRHAPCGDTYQPANVDPTYPFRNGDIGHYGMDIPAGKRIILPTAKDLMSYCPNNWVSAYTYSAASSYRAAAANRSIGVADTVLMLAGMITPAGLRLDPAYTLRSTPDADDRSGSHEVTGRSADGRILFRQRFSPLRVEDGDTRRRPFVVSVRLARGVSEQLASIRVDDLSRSAPSASRERSRPVLTPQGPGAPRLGTRIDNGGNMVSWNAGEFPSGIVRNQRTGAVVAMSDRGEVRLPRGSGDDFELLLSNGVSSVSRIVSGRTGQVAP